MPHDLIVSLGLIRPVLRKICQAECVVTVKVLSPLSLIAEHGRVMVAISRRQLKLQYLADLKYLSGNLILVTFGSYECYQAYPIAMIRR